MNYETRSIEHDIVAARNALGEQLVESQQKFRAAVSWRTHFQKNPLPFLAGAAALGLVASATIGRPGTTFAVLNDAAHSTRNALDSSHLRGRTARAFENLADSLFAVGTATFATYVDRWLPGFREEMNRRA
jgi:hypothetical protein